MKNYMVTFERTAFTYIEVNANSPEEAEDFAIDKYKSRVDEWGVLEITKVKEIK